MQIRYSLITGSEPVTSTEVKAWLKVDFSDEDTLISALSTQVRELAEESAGLDLVEKNINVDMETTIQEIGALLETIQGYPLPKVLLESYEIFKYITALKDLTYFKKLRIAIKIFGKYLEYAKDASFFPEFKPLLEKLAKSCDLFIISHNKTETIMEHFPCILQIQL